jgi:DNA/RNA-binding domain of Phe-tRNA-synthetase-like protein
MRFDLDHPTLRLGLVYAGNVSVAASPPALLFALSTLEDALRRAPEAFPEETRSEIRNVLRRGGYKPTGRGKPASEFLLGQALGEGIPRINALVDINNLVSLQSAHPISVFDADRLGPDTSLRFGRAGEQYVFNASGQSMDIAGLPVVCRGQSSEPVGNAVKDSMLCKVGPDTRRVLFVVYGSRVLPSAQLEACLASLSKLCQEHLSASDLAGGLVPD